VKLPFIGHMKVEGMTTSDVEAKLALIYSNFIENPQVDVEVSAWNSRFIYVLGAVRQPGKYNLRDRIPTLRDALNIAGLPTDRAALWRVFVVRRDPQTGKVRYIPINAYRILYRGKLEHDITIEPGDTVYVPMGLLDQLATFVGRIISPIAGAATNTVRAATVTP
jgi:polysaccharide export outer membrane protein